MSGLWIDILLLHDDVNFDKCTTETYLHNLMYLGIYLKKNTYFSAV